MTAKEVIEEALRLLVVSTDDADKADLARKITVRDNLAGFAPRMSGGWRVQE